MQDFGPGLTPLEQVEVFEPMLDKEDIRRSAGLGSGLGLAMVKEMVSALRGEISVESLAGEGTTFAGSFPEGASSAAPRS